MLKIITEDLEFQNLLENLNTKEFNSIEEITQTLKESKFKQFTLKESDQAGVVEVRRILRG